MSEVRLYSTLEEVLRTGATLDCRREPAQGGYVRVVSLGTRKDLLALGIGVTLHEALTTAEHDYLSDGPVAGEFFGDNCPTCAMNRRHPTGSLESVSALDAHVLDGWRFGIEWSNEHFRLATEWRRDARPAREIMRQLITEGVPTRWCHGEFVWEIIPGRSRKTGEWKFAHFKSLSRPPASKEIYPVEKRRAEAEGSSLVVVLNTAEELMAAARHEDQQWQCRTTRCT